MAYEFQELTEASTPTATVGSVSAYELSEQQPAPVEEYFVTFSSPTSFYIYTLGSTSKPWDGTIEYSIDKVNWITWTNTNSYANRMAAANNGTEYVLFVRGTGNTTMGATGGTTTSEGSWFCPLGSVSIKGKIETLLDYQTVAQGGHPTMASACFANLFARENAPANLNSYIDISGLDFTVGTLTDNCFHYMFRNNFNLVSLPQTLPATTLTTRCYSSMFYGCTNITTSPSLPATTLAERCYESMFYGCTSLVNPPVLSHITRLDNYACISMFNGCTSLAKLPIIDSAYFNNYALRNMFYNCSLIKIAETQDSEYVNAYKLPYYRESVTFTGTSPTKAMFTGTGGTFTSDPVLKTTYYTSNVVI